MRVGEDGQGRIQSQFLEGDISAHSQIAREREEEELGILEELA